MAGLLLLALLAIYRPEYWQYYPSMDNVRCISVSNSSVYIAVPKGVYILDRGDYRYVRCLTQADGIAGEVRLCAFNQGRSDLFIATDDHLYQFLTATGLLTELDKPFKQVKSIGIAQDGAWFDTDAGLFHKHRTAPEFEPRQYPPATITWYGERDTMDARDYTFLTPWFTVDDQLMNHNLTIARRDKNNRLLFVAAEGYGVVVYNMRSGFKQAHLRFGPTDDRVQRVLRMDNRLWFYSGDRSVALDSAGNWGQYFARPGDVFNVAFRLLSGAIINLNSREGIFALLPVAGRLLLGTRRGIYSLSPDRKLAELARLQRPVNAIAEIRDSILIGTDDGLFLLTDDTLAVVEDPYARTDWGVFDIARTPEGQTWFGTLGGVLLLDSTDRWYHFIPPGFDLAQPVRALAAADSFLFIGTPAGLTAYNTRTESWTTLDQAKGLPSTNITALYADSRYLWIASPGILTRLDYRNALR